MRSIHAALTQIAQENPGARGVLLPLLRQADKWNTLPPGWTESSREKFWNTLTGDSTKKVTRCIEKMEGKINDPGAFCASLADQVEGPEWRSHPKKAASWTLEEATEKFEKWYKTEGHWVYPTKEKALDTWRTRGIEGLPDYRKLKKTAMRDLQVQTSALPLSLKTILAEVKYTRRKISLLVRNKYSDYSAGDDGYRGFTASYNMNTNQRTLIKGAFGGGGLGARLSPVDNTSSPDKPLSDGLVIIQGQEGGLGTLAFLIVNDHTLEMLKESATQKGRKKAETSRLGFNKFNPTELLSQLIGVLKGAGLEETVEELQRLRVPQIVTQAWSTRAKSAREASLTEDEFEAKYGVRPWDRFEDEHGVWVVLPKDTKTNSMVNIRLLSRGPNHVIVTDTLTLKKHYKKLPRKSGSVSNNAALNKSANNIGFLFDSVFQASVQGKSFVEGRHIKDYRAFKASVLNDSENWLEDWTVSSKLNVVEVTSKEMVTPPVSSRVDSYGNRDTPEREDLEVATSVFLGVSYKINVVALAKKFAKRYRNLLVDPQEFADTFTDVVGSRQVMVDLGRLLRASAPAFLGVEPLYLAQKFEDDIRDVAQQASSPEVDYSLEGFRLSDTSQKMLGMDLEVILNGVVSLGTKIGKRATQNRFASNLSGAFDKVFLPFLTESESSPFTDYADFKAQVLRNSEDWLEDWTSGFEVKNIKVVSKGKTILSEKALDVVTEMSASLVFRANLKLLAQRFAKNLYWRHLVDGEAFTRLFVTIVSRNPSDLGHLLALSAPDFVRVSPFISGKLFHEPIKEKAASFTSPGVKYEVGDFQLKSASQKASSAFVEVTLNGEVSLEVESF